MLSAFGPKAFTMMPLVPAQPSGPLSETPEQKRAEELLLA
jgi:hypothetical protein